MIPALIIFIKSFAIDPLLYNAELMGENLNYLEPFIAVVNSETLNLVIPLVKYPPICYKNRTNKLVLLPDTISDTNYYVLSCSCTDWNDRTDQFVMYF